MKPAVLPIDDVIVQGGQSSTNPSENGFIGKVASVSEQEIQSHPKEIVQTMERT